MGDKTFSERMNSISEGSQWKRIDDGAIGTILEIRDDNSNNLVVRWTHPSFEGSRAGECDRYEFARKWVPLESHPDDIPVKVDSIWKSNKTGDIVKVLIEPNTCDPSVHYINLNNTTDHCVMSRMDKTVFVTEHKFLRDNDNGALYIHNKNNNTYLKVIETTKKASCMGTIDFVKYRVIKGDSVEDGHEALIVTFHECCHLLSLDPVKEYSVPIDSVKTIKVEDKEMDNSKETYLKTDESKMKEFSSGAKREDKSGKGRYDLIPGDIMADFVNYAWESYFNEGPMTICDTDISLSAYFDDMTDEGLFFEFILNMTCLFFTDYDELDETTDCVGERSYVVTWEAFHKALYKMRWMLAKHYEAGAKVHGVNNWKKGIPISDSERGGNFVDSIRRHADQALRGLDDEPHAISAIWNAFAAIWTLRNNASIVNSSETKSEMDVESKDCEGEFLTLPSGRKMRIPKFLKNESFHLMTDDERDRSFLRGLPLNDDVIDSIMESLIIVNDAGNASKNMKADKASDKIADAPTVSYSVLKANMSNCIELLSKMLVDNKSTDLKFETHEAYINLYMICVLLKSVLPWFQENDKARVCIEHLISGIYDLINTNIPSVRRIFNNVRAKWVEGYDEVYEVCLGEPDKYRVLGMIDLCCRTGMKLINDDHFCGRAISNGLLFDLKEHLSKLVKE